ncbi:putative germin-like protein 2-1 [Silene latifolia]|uniref:putative germin-like protein 2-1 n=1 Tax=Silene latifolia TaxID=37657 RepID=UPI003D777A9B
METKVGMIAIICMAFAMSFYVAMAADPSPLQSFCVGINDPNSAVFVNGKFCKNPKDVSINDFIHKGFNVAGNTSNIQGANATLVDESLFPGLNTLGVAMARVDFAPYGLNTPHLHPLGSEIFAVMEGSLYAGFVTTDNKLFDTVIGPGDMIVFPQGLVHFQLNIGDGKALAIASFGSQNPLRVNVPNALFGTNPPILDDVLTKAFQVDGNVIDKLRGQFPGQENGVETGRSILRLIQQNSS